ncbi:hypothetical protein I5M27_12670 [Adhaeribacter sp. BT258]|uniref:Uncharacterized protein n=1 Tax=Adhaeribacter terrigena TaxID=2793070 RepID=A0ABS1C3C5_9BACT|nr:hypothetical protein [Adhaeribacter terrigena]MBK0403845.1 hypothetical protein [Adhaeribacter terrigena]
MPPNLLRVRFLQFRREWRTLGLLHKGLFCLLFLTLTAISYSNFQEQPNCWFLVGGLWMAAVFTQLFRPDKSFVLLHLAKPHQAIFLEYAVISLPFILPALFSPNWFCLFIFLAGLFPITFLRTSFQIQTRFVFLGKILPPTAFEWIAGFRKNFPLLVVVYALALALSWVKMLPLLLLWLFCGIILGFYQFSEPLLLLRTCGQNPATLLKKKLLEMGELLLFICLPVIFLHAVFHPWLGLAGLAFLMLQFCVLAFAILLKYSTYEPNKTLNSNLLLLTFAQMSVVLPFFILLPIALVFRQYRKAKQNLTLYLPPC